MAMTQAEQDALYNAALARRDASQKQDNTTANQVKEADAATPLPEEKRAFGVQDMNAASVMELRKLGPVGQIEKAGKSADDIVRVAAGKAGDVLAAAMTPGSFDENALYEAAKTRMAAGNLNAAQPGLATGVGIAGDIGKVAVLPGAAFATPLAAAGTGAAISGVDTMFDRLSKGEPVNTDAEGYVDDMAKGAILGFGGYHLGKLISNSLSRFVGKDPSITAAAQKALEDNKAIVDRGVNDMASSGVNINSMGQNRLLYNLEKQLGKTYELSPKTTPQAWKAISILRDRVAQGAGISLQNFNELRNAVGRSLYSETGLLKRDVTTQDLKIVDDIYKAMGKFVNDLPITRQFVQSGGNVKQALKGWDTMTKFQQTQNRSEKIAELITNAEAKAASGGNGSLEENLMREFKGLTESEAGRQLAKRMFTPEQIAAIKRIANGDVSEKTFATLDKWIGGNAILRPLFRMVNSLHGAGFQAEESRQIARKMIEKAGGVQLPKRPGVRWGVATTVGSGNRK